MDAPPRSSRSSAAELARLFAALPMGVLHLTDERVDYANEAVANMLGYTPEELIGEPIMEMLTDDTRPLVERRYRARQKGEVVPERYELEIHRRDRKVIRLEIEPVVTGPRQHLIMVRDVTDRLRDTSLLAALSESALRVQRAGSVEQALLAAGSGLTALGLHLMVARLEGDNLVIEYVAATGDAAAQIERLVPRPLHGMVVPVGHVQEAFAPVLRERRMIFVEEAAPFFATKLLRWRPELDSAALQARLFAAGFGRCVLCPLLVEGAVWGMLGAAANNLTSADAAALGLYASHVASAIETNRAIARLERRNQELAAVQEVARAGSEPSLPELLKRLVRIASDLLHAEAAAIWLLDEKHASLELAECTDSMRPLALRYRSVPLEGATLHDAVRLKAANLPVQRLDEALHAALAEAGMRRLAGVPMHIKGKLAGFLALGRSEDTPFSVEDLASAELAVAQMAIQIETARLYADASRRLRLVSTLFDLSKIGTDALEVRPLVERVIGQARSALAVDGAAIHVLEGGRLVLVAQMGTNSAHEQQFREVACDLTSLVGRAVLERRTLTMDEKDWRDLPSVASRIGPARCIAVAPLISKDRVLGTLFVERNAPRPFDEEERRLLESFAAQAGAALGQARSFDEERRRVEELKLFLEVGRVITASLDLEQILDASAGSLARIAEATDCFILLLDPARRVLKGVTASAPEHREHFRTVRIAIEDRSVVSQTVLTRLPVRVAEVTGANFLRADLVERYRQRSLMVLPLTVRDEAIGAVMLSDSRGPRDWSDAQIERATVLARQVAVAAANARLYEDLKKSYEELARAQEELVKRERLAALGELAAVVAHEVRNPLGVIFNSLRSLAKVLKPEGDARMLLGIVGEEADRLNRIVGDLLDFARPSEPALSPEPLGAVLVSVQEAAAQAAAANGVKIQVLDGEPSPKAVVDARMLRQALLNLVLNAIQAMPKGGTVTLSAREEKVHEKALARIEVSDNGPGIPPELVERVFQPFFTTKASGTGLGLAVVKRIAEAHRGEVSLSSSPGHGARFTLRVPLKPSTVDSQESRVRNGSRE